MCQERSHWRQAARSAPVDKAAGIRVRLANRSRSSSWSIALLGHAFAFAPLASLLRISTGHVDHESHFALMQHDRVVFLVLGCLVGATWRCPRHCERFGDACSNLIMAAGGTTNRVR